MTKSEYNRIRKNILATARRYKSKGYSIPNIPKTLTQAGFKNITSRQYEMASESLKDWEKQLKQSIKYQKEKQGLEYARYNDVFISNFKKNLETKSYAKGADVVSKWFDELREKVSDDRVVDIIETAENSGVEVDRYVKYGKEEYAFSYIGDMSKILYNSGVLDEDEIEDILTNISDLNENYEIYTEEILGDLGDFYED